MILVIITNADVTSKVHIIYFPRCHRISNAGKFMRVCKQPVNSGKTVTILLYHIYIIPHWFKNINTCLGSCDLIPGIPSVCRTCNIMILITHSKLWCFTSGLYGNGTDPLFHCNIRSSLPTDIFACKNQVICTCSQHTTHRLSIFFISIGPLISLIIIFNCRAVLVKCERCCKTIPVSNMQHRTYDPAWISKMFIKFSLCMKHIYRHRCYLVCVHLTISQDRICPLDSGSI